MPKTQLFWVFIVSPGTSTRGATRDLAGDLDSNLWRRESRSLGTKWKPKNVEFWPLADTSGQNQLYHTPLLSKIWDLNDRRKKIVNNPFKHIVKGLNSRLCLRCCVINLFWPGLTLFFLKQGGPLFSAPFLVHTHTCIFGNVGTTHWVASVQICGWRCLFSDWLDALSFCLKQNFWQKSS